MNIELMRECHKERVLELSKEFYCSDALDHEIPLDIVSSNINVAISDDNSLIGYVFCDDDKVVGFSYITTYYETEIGGMCLQIIDLYVESSVRGKGIATQYFNYLFNKYTEAKRFRLEVVSDNEPAISLYKKLGFENVSYSQMKIDKDNK